jgi:hypothetical protein
MKWRGTDGSESLVKAGTFILAISLNGKEADAMKMVKR